MPYTVHEKKRVTARVKRIRGQTEALLRALDADQGCAAVLQQIAAIRGAVNGLMSEVMEAHIRETFGQTPDPPPERSRQIEELNSLVRSYLK